MFGLHLGNEDEDQSRITTREAREGRSSRGREREMDRREVKERHKWRIK